MTDKRSDLGPNDEVQKAGADASGASNPGVGAASAADMQALIGRQLRAVFDDVAKQPVPDRFIELMKQLDKASAG